MAVKIRLTRLGRKKIPFYRLVAANSEMRRDGRWLEQLGTVNPLTDPATIKLEQDRVRFWIEQGAKPTDTASQIIDKIMPGYLTELESKRTEKIRSKRAARKARARARA